MHWNTSSRRVAIVWATGLLLLCPSRFCHAGLLNFQLNPNGPVVLGINGSLSFDSSTGEFSSTTVPLTFSSPTLPGGGFVRFSGATETIDLFVNSDGTFRGNGTGFDLTGALSIGGTNISGTLLTGSITDFGADSAGPPTLAFNGLFKITGGLLTAPIALDGGGTLPTQFPLGAAPGGFILFAETVASGTLGDFTSSFSSTSVKKNDGLVLASVPEPATVWLLVIGLAAIIGFVGITKRTACASTY